MSQALREAARAAGHKHFNSGKPCRRGHVGHRYVSTGACCTCIDTRNSRDLAERRLLGQAARGGAFVMVIAEGDFEEAEAFCRALNLRRGLPPGSRVVPGTTVATMPAPAVQLPAREPFAPLVPVATSPRVQQQHDDAENAERAERMAAVAARLAALDNTPVTPYIPAEMARYLTNPSSNG